MKRNQITKRNSELTINLNEHSNIGKLTPDLSHLSPERKNSILNLVRRRKDVFAAEKFDIGRVRKHDARIKLSEYRYIA